MKNQLFAYFKEDIIIIHLWLYCHKYLFSIAVETFIGFIHKIYVLFLNSSKSWCHIRTKLKLTLISLFETRRESRIRAVKAIILQFNDVIEYVNDLKNKIDDSKILSD